ncbi:MAG: uncharacterized protein JWP97_2698 [Labilithrix sp.]|nr:uncharacterized protein [Labilithrix sp.]
MIIAAKTGWFNAWFARHARGRIQRTFGRVLVQGLERTRGLCAGSPVLFVANHTTWWDALIALYASELLLRVDGYAMMDAANLARLPFFRRVGAFGVDLASPSDGARGIRYAGKLLGAPGRAVWVFPEGRERSPFAPLELLPGAAVIARIQKRALVVPVGLRYVFAGAEQPDLRISFGEPLAREVDVDRGVRAQKEAIERELVRIDTSFEAEPLPPGFDVIFARRPSAVGRLAERLLALLLR